LTEDIKAALLQLASKVAYIDEHGQDYYDALESALYPPANLIRIEAVYTQGGVVMDNANLDDLRSDLVVTAVYSDATTEVVTSYTLSGTLTEGTSTITVAYGGKTDTFDVTVTAYVPYVYYDYLEGDGSAFIDTDLLASTYASDDYTKYIKFKPNVLTKEKSLFGVRSAWGTTGVLVQANASGSQSLAIAFGNAWKYSTITQDNLYELTLEHPTITLNGSTVATVSNATPTISSATMTITLFALLGGERPTSAFVVINGGYAAQFCDHKIYRFTVVEKSSGVTIADMRPAIRSADGAVGMHDVVRDRFFTNCNESGAFTIGNDA
jgi:hypothetical protein